MLAPGASVAAELKVTSVPRGAGEGRDGVSASVIPLAAVTPNTTNPTTASLHLKTPDIVSSPPLDGIT